MATTAQIKYDHAHPDATMPAGFCKYQKAVQAFYSGKKIQIVVAALIVLNFGVQCVSKQIDPYGDKYETIWHISEDFFNIMFLLELLVNMYGSWMRRFFLSKWNRFDCVVVLIGALDLCRVPLPGPLKLVRMLRAFRVFRLFGKVESIKKILIMIRRAIPGVVSAFILLFIVLCIYSVLSVDFFRNIHSDCHAVEPPAPTAITPRGKCFGEDYFGNFLRALYTFFQVLTGESWSEAAVRPVIQYFENSVAETIGISIFFVSFFLINSIVLLNVVVAVLIEGMSGGVADEVIDSEEEEDDDQLTTPGVDENGEEVKKTAKVKNPKNPCPYEELQEFQDGTQEDVCMVKADVHGMKEQLSTLQEDLREQTAAIAQALRECRPRRLLPKKGGEIASPNHRSTATHLLGQTTSAKPFKLSL